MTQFVNDLFNGTPADTLSVYNPAWQKVTGATGEAIITAGGDRLRFSGTTLYYLSSAPAPSADYSATIELYIASTTSGPGVGVAVRLAGTAQTYYLARLLNGTGIQLYRVVNGTSTLLGSAPYTSVAGATLRIRLDAKGSSLNVYLDDATTPAISATDTVITEPGYVGIRSINAASQILIESLIADDGVASGGSTTTTVAPGATALTVTGLAPTISRTANQSVSPAPASLTVRGYAPTIAQVAAGTRTVSPGPAALTVRGFAPTITQTGQQPAQGPASTGGGGAGSVRDVRAFADELDRVQKPTKAQKKQRRRLIEAAVLELLPDEPAAERVAPIIAQAVARQLPPASWAPVRAMQPITLPPAVVDDVRARVDEWLSMQMLLADLEDEFETELLLLG